MVKPHRALTRSTLASWMIKLRPQLCAWVISLQLLIHSSKAAFQRFSLRRRISFGFAFPRFMIGLINSHHFLNPESNRISLASLQTFPRSFLTDQSVANSTFYSFQTRQFSVFFILRELQENSWVDIEFRGNKTHWSGRPKSSLLMLYHISYLAGYN